MVNVYVPRRTSNFTFASIQESVLLSVYFVVERSVANRISLVTYVSILASVLIIANPAVNVSLVLTTFPSISLRTFIIHHAEMRRGGEGSSADNKLLLEQQFTH